MLLATLSSRYYLFCSSGKLWCRLPVLLAAPARGAQDGLRGQLKRWLKWQLSVCLASFADLPYCLSCLSTAGAVLEFCSTRHRYGTWLAAPCAMLTSVSVELASDAVKLLL